MSKTVNTQKLYPQHRHQWNTTPSPGEENLEPSKTVKGEAYTIPELFRRSANGLGSPAAKVPIWDENPTHDDVDLDSLDRSDLTEQSEEYIKAINQDVENFEKNRVVKIKTEAKTTKKEGTTDDKEKADEKEKPPD